MDITALDLIKIGTPIVTIICFMWGGHVKLENMEKNIKEDFKEVKDTLLRHDDRIRKVETS